MDDRSNTIAGWVLGAGIVALGASIVTGEMFHSERPEKMGYPIEGVTGVGGESGGEAEQPIAVYLAAADAAKGEQVFKKCTACPLPTRGPNAPSNSGSMGGPTQACGRFPYSPALSAREQLGLDSMSRDQVTSFRSGTKIRSRVSVARAAPTPRFSNSSDAPFRFRRALGRRTRPGRADGVAAAARAEKEPG